MRSETSSRSLAFSSVSCISWNEHLSDSPWTILLSSRTSECFLQRASMTDWSLWFSSQTALSSSCASENTYALVRRDLKSFAVVLCARRPLYRQRTTSSESVQLQILLPESEVFGFQQQDFFLVIVRVLPSCVERGLVAFRRFFQFLGLEFEFSLRSAAFAPDQDLA